VGSPPCLAREVAGKELAFARGRFEQELEVGTTGNEARGDDCWGSNPDEAWGGGGQLMVVVARGGFRVAAGGVGLSTERRRGAQRSACSHEETVVVALYTRLHFASKQRGG
jgi:hypothetical protein